MTVSNVVGEGWWLSCYNFKVSCFEKLFNSTTCFLL